MFWKVALSGLLDSAFKEPKDQTDANKVPEQDTLTRGAVGKVQRKETKIAKVERTITYRTKRKFLQKFSRVTLRVQIAGVPARRNYRLLSIPLLWKWLYLLEAKER